MGAMTNQKSNKFGLGLILGAVSGALTGIFLTPKTGKKMRADVLKRAKQIRQMIEDTDASVVISDMFDEVTEKSTAVYNEIKDMVSEKLADLTESIDSIDKEKYLRVVRSVVDELKNKKELTEQQLEKVKQHLEKDYEKLTPKSAKKVAQKATTAKAKKS